MKDLIVLEKDNISSLEYKIKFSFNITYILLLTTATITFIEAITTSNTKFRHILNLETAISVIAGYFYSIFTKKINESYEKNEKVNWADFTKTRYIDWFITTPLMLLVLSLVLGENINISVKLPVILLVILLNYLMLYFGYLGETLKLDKNIAVILGFISFGLMYFIIYYNYIRPKFKLDNIILFVFYIFFWSCYGVSYMLDEEHKNISYNILDLIAKCFVGIGLWVYFTKIILFK